MRHLMQNICRRSLLSPFTYFPSQRSISFYCLRLLMSSEWKRSNRSPSEQAFLIFHSQHTQYVMRFSAMAFLWFAAEVVCKRAGLWSEEPFLYYSLFALFSWNATWKSFIRPVKWSVDHHEAMQLVKGCKPGPLITPIIISGLSYNYLLPVRAFHVHRLMRFHLY